MTARVYVEIQCDADSSRYVGVISSTAPRRQCERTVRVQGDRRREAERAAEDLGWTSVGKQGSREHYCKSHTPPG